MTYTDDEIGVLREQITDLKDQVREQQHTIRTLRLELAQARVSNPLRGRNFHAAA